MMTTNEKQPISAAEQDKKPYNLLAKTGILAFFSAWGYVLVYLYEIGIAKAYHYPEELIAVDFTNLLVVIASITSIVFMLGAILTLIYSIWSRSNSPISPIKRNVLFNCVFAFPFVGLFFLFGPLWNEWIYWLIVPIMSIFSDFCLPLFRRTGQTYSEKLKEADERNQNAAISKLMNCFVGRNNVHVVIVALFIAFTLFMSYNAGKASALKKEEYMTFSDGKKEWVVLRASQDRCLCSPLNRETKAFEKRIMIVRLAQNPSVVLTLETIGRLTPAITTTSQPSTRP